MSLGQLIQLPSVGWGGRLSVVLRQVQVGQCKKRKHTIFYQTYPLGQLYVYLFVSKVLSQFFKLNLALEGTHTDQGYTLFSTKFPGYKISIETTQC